MTLRPFFFKLLLLFSFAFITSEAHAQIFCPPNLDFENGNLGNWQFFTGQCCPITIFGNSGPLTNRHVATSGITVDPYGFFPIVGDGLYSLKLGNDLPGYEVDRALYYVHVPSTPGQYILTYRYAIVMEDPSHEIDKQPRFEVRTYDSATHTVLPCNEHLYISADSLPYFTQSPANSTVYFRPWATATIDLSPYAGSTVAIEFTSADCGMGAHFGYGYVDMRCGLFKVEPTYCDDTTKLTLTGPPGFQSYGWYNGTFTNLLATTPTMVVPKPFSPTTYALIITPFPGLGCPDTFIVNYPSAVTGKMDVTLDKNFAVCDKPIGTLTNSFNNPFGPFTYLWSPSTGLNCTSCPSPQVTQPGTYQLIVTNARGCSDTDTVHVVFDTAPSVNAGKDTAMCPGAIMFFNGSGNAANYQWLPAATLVNANTTTPYGFPTTTTPYKLIGYSPKGCSDTDEVLVTVFPKPGANAGNDTALCAGTVLTLRGKGNGNYSWKPVVDMVNPTWANPRIEAVNDITYTLTVTDALGCVDSDKVKITVYPVPVASAGLDTILCDPDTVTLKGSGSGTYQWYPATGLSDPTSASPTVFINKSIAYFLKVTSPMGCSDSDQVSIGMAPPPVFTVTPMEGEVCPGIGLRFHANGGIYYKWDPPATLSSDNDPDPFARPTETTTYSVRMLDMCANDTTIFVEVKVKPAPSIVIDKPNDIDCGFNEVKLTATGAESYVWSPLSAFSDARVANPVVHPKETSEYTVIGRNKEGCYDTAKITVGVNKEFQLGLPNAFSPDADGSNDCFRLLVKKQPVQFEISIFNRWGNMVFRTTDINACWDGSYNGTQQPAGVYVYYTKLLFDGCGEIKKTGNVTLLR